MKTALLKSMKALDESSKGLMERERAEATAKKKKAKAKRAKVSRHKAQPLGEDNQPKEGDLVISPFLPGAIGTVTEKFTDRRRDALPAFGGTAWVTPQVEVLWLYTDSSKEYINDDGYMEYKAEKRRVVYEQKEFDMLVKVGNINPEYTVHSFCGVEPRPTQAVRDEINSGRSRMCEHTGKLQHHDEHHRLATKGNYSSMFTVWDKLLKTEIEKPAAAPAPPPVPWF